jgi:hypothetical protein
MNIVISIHLFPHELDRYATTLTNLNDNLRGVADNIVLYTTLNTSSEVINWENSAISKCRAVEAYTTINKTIPNNNNTHEVYHQPRMYGVNDHRRKTYQKYFAYDCIIYLDTDIIFSNQILRNYIELIDKVRHTNPWYVITPQTVRLWDTTWDCIVNKHYIKHRLNSHLTLSPHEVISNTDNIPRTPTTSSTYKFAGGWFTAYSPKLLNFVGIPSSFGGYGPDDTFLMACMCAMRRTGWSVSQYIMENEIIMETQNTSDLSGLFKIPAEEQRITAQLNFIPELRNFVQKL